MLYRGMNIQIDRETLPTGRVRLNTTVWLPLHSRIPVISLSPGRHVERGEYLSRWVAERYIDCLARHGITPL